MAIMSFAEMNILGIRNLYIRLLLLVHRFRKARKTEWVWYAAYGSNLCSELFLGYIRGGPRGSSNRIYDGCKDKSPPIYELPYIIPHRLFFAGEYGWNGQASAFVRSTRDGESYGRLFLITFPQFDQVIQQEQGIRSPSEHLICPSLSRITENSICYTNPGNPFAPLPEDRTKRKRYGRILNLGEEHGLPVLTFTAIGPDVEIAPGAPSRDYLDAIARGIRETFPAVTTVQIREYLLAADGVRDNISAEQLSRWFPDNLAKNT
jgi:hypothetical protein